VLIGAYLVFERTRPRHPVLGALRQHSIPAVTPQPAPQGPPAAAPFVDSPSIANAIATHAHEVPVNAAGVVSRVLPDDREGERHQRVIVRLPSGTTVLLAYNIDIAPRIEGLQSGAPIIFAGEYVWNQQGGVVHWTHHDPSGHHKGGFVKYNGRIYE
jgi:Protein of unknown function (DUF3465)